MQWLLLFALPLHAGATHSSFQCTSEHWQQRTCTLSNVCAISPFTPLVKYFYYMANAAETMPPSPVASALGRIDDTDTRHAFDVQVVIEPMPNASWVHGTTMLSRRYGVGNWGHLLADNLLPIFAAYELMGTAPLHLAFDDVCGYQGGGNGQSLFPKHPDHKHFMSTLFEYTPESCAHMTQRVYPYVTDEQLLFLRGDDLYASPVANSENTVCFERLVVGYGKWGAFGATGGFAELSTGTLRRFRKFVWARYPFSPSVYTALVAVKPEFSRRRITNSNEILARMLEWHWAAEAVDFSKLSMNETISLMHSVSLVVSPGGATCLINLFMRPGSRLLLAPYCDCDASTFVCAAPTHDYYKVLVFNSDVTTEYMPVRTRDEVSPGAGGHCDVRVVDFGFIQQRGNF
jgi:hypothetical protein